MSRLNKNDIEFQTEYLWNFECCTLRYHNVRILCSSATTASLTFIQYTFLRHSRQLLSALSSAEPTVSHFSYAPPF